MKINILQVGGRLPPALGTNRLQKWSLFDFERFSQSSFVLAFGSKRYISLNNFFEKI